MRKGTWLLIGVVALTTVLAMGAVACEDDDDGNGDATATQPAGETPAGETPAGDATPTESAAGGDAVEVTINEVDGSGVTGTATLTPTDSGFDAEVSAEGLEEGTHASHIHQGSTCADPTAGVAEPLGDVVADAAGSGTGNISSTNQLSTYQDGNSYVAVHALDGSVVGCGDIPAAG
jgi:hypothetical protein